MKPFRGQNESRPVTDPKIGNRATRLGGSGGPIRPVAYVAEPTRYQDTVSSLRRSSGRLLSRISFVLISPTR